MRASDQAVSLRYRSDELPLLGYGSECYRSLEAKELCDLIALKELLSLDALQGTVRPHPCLEKVESREAGHRTTPGSSGRLS